MKCLDSMYDDYAKAHWKDNFSNQKSSFHQIKTAIKTPSDHTEQDALGSLLWQRAFWIFSASAERGFNRMAN